jgi:hypothetical protein
MSIIGKVKEGCPAARKKASTLNYDKVRVVHVTNKKVACLMEKQDTLFNY